MHQQISGFTPRYAEESRIEPLGRRRVETVDLYFLDGESQSVTVSELIRAYGLRLVFAVTHVSLDMAAHQDSAGGRNIAMQWRLRLSEAHEVMQEMQREMKLKEFSHPKSSWRLYSFTLSAVLVPVSLLSDEISEYLDSFDPDALPLSYALQTDGTCSTDPVASWMVLNIASRLLDETADAFGADSDYGRGVIDLVAAVLRPAGATRNRNRDGLVAGHTRSTSDRSYAFVPGDRAAFLDAIAQDRRRRQ